MLDETNINSSNELGTMMFRGQLLILLVVCIHNSACIINNMYNAGTEVWKLNSMIDEFVSNATDNGMRGDNTIKKEIRHKMDDIHLLLISMDESLKPKAILKSMNSWPFQIMLYKSLDRLELFIQNIDDYYNEFYRSLIERMHYSQEFWHKLKNITISVEGIIPIMRRIVTERGDLLPNYQNIVHAMASFTASLHSRICNSPRVVSEILMYLFEMVIVAEMKANVMMAISKLYQYPQAVVPFDELFGAYVNLFAQNIQITDAFYLRACEPDAGIWIRTTIFFIDNNEQSTDESFYELEGTFQTIIYRHHWTNCLPYSCNIIWSQKAKKCRAEFYDVRTSCPNAPEECDYLSAIKACVLKRGPYKFQYVDSTKLGLMGPNHDCPKDNGYIIEDGTGWNYTHGACACNCYRNNNKISLSIIESVVKSNMIITGLRFVRRNKILYIQPREGKLIANGHIRQYSERWISIPRNIKISQIHTINKENRIFFLDDLHLPPDFVLTGIKFNKVTRGTVTGFAIEIFGHPFNYTSGQLTSDSKFRISKEASNKTSREPLLFKAINPVTFNRMDRSEPTGMDYVSLQRSELSSDFGQSTLPFFDAVPITIPQPSALGGIGIFHKSDGHSAGFISLRVYGITYSKYFENFQLSMMKYGKVLFNNSQH